MKVSYLKVATYGVWGLLFALVVMLVPRPVGFGLAQCHTEMCQLCHSEKYVPNIVSELLGARELVAEYGDTSEQCVHNWASVQQEWSTQTGPSLFDIAIAVVFYAMNLAVLLSAIGFRPRYLAIAYWGMFVALCVGYFYLFAGYFSDVVLDSKGLARGRESVPTKAAVHMYYVTTYEQLLNRSLWGLTWIEIVVATALLYSGILTQRSPAQEAPHDANPNMNETTEKK